LPGAKGRLRTNPEVPEEDIAPPRADPREQALPWDMRILRQTGAARPGRAGWDGGVVCGKGAADPSAPRGTTSATAGSRIACGKCSVGRRRSVNATAGRSRRDDKGTPRRNASGGPARRGRREAHRRHRRPPRRLRIVGPARGHAATGPRKFSATGLVATSPRVMRAMRATAARSARQPCVRCRTANASGCGATAMRADSNAAWSTNWRRPNAVNAARPQNVPLWGRRRPRDRKVRS
jgi:hypothetical protein